MRFFNSFQLVVLFACFPFLIGWLHGGPFAYSTALMWVAIAAYLFEFAILTACLGDELGKYH